MVFNPTIRNVFSMPRVWETNPNMLIPYYLMFSYLYYVKNISLIEDTEFDQMCKTLLEKLDGLTHMHKHLVQKENLTAELDMI